MAKSDKKLVTIPPGTGDKVPKNTFKESKPENLNFKRSINKRLPKSKMVSPGYNDVSELIQRIDDLEERVTKLERSISKMQPTK